MGPSRGRAAARKAFVSLAVVAALFTFLPRPLLARSIQNDRAAALPASAEARRLPRLPSPLGGSGRTGRDSTAFATVTCTVLDGGTGSPLSARATVIDRDDKYRHPLPSSACFYHGPAGKCGGYFFTDGAFALEVPLGKTFIGLGHGFEYTTVTDTVYVQRDTSLVYVLEQWTNMNGSGWFSGDCHLHMAHAGGVYDLTPEDVWFMGNAEDLNVINCMDGPFSGQPDPASTPDCVLYISEEQRSSVYGHSALMGLSSLYFPGHSDWWPLIMDMADEVHLQPGAAVVSVHPATAGSFFDIESVSGTMKARELPLDVITGRVDGMEVVASDFLDEDGELDLWYRLLNCGFQVPPCAGTDAVMDRGFGRPLGCFKAYVRLPAGTFNFWNWLKELFRSETFVSNGPLITAFSLGHHVAGDAPEIEEEPPVTFEGHLSVSCSFPLRRADIVRNGETLKSFFFGYDQCAMDTTFTVSIDESSWVAARVYGDNESWFTVEDSLFAHTGPIYLKLNGEQILETSDAFYFLQWVQDLEELADIKGEWSDPEESRRFYTETAKACQYYLALATGIDTGLPEEPTAGGIPDIRLSARPNPFADRAAIRFALPAPAGATLRVYTSSGRLVRTVADRWFTAGEHAVTWDGRDSSGREVGSGIYLCRLDAGDVTSDVKLVLIR